MPATILELGGRYPGAAVLFAAPLTVAGIWGMVTRPSLALPLVLLAGVALVLIDFLAGPYRMAEQKARVAGAQKLNRQPLVNQPRMEFTQTPPRQKAAEAQAGAQAEAAAAQALAADAEAVAAEARARADAAAAEALAAEAEALAAEAEALAAEARAQEEAAAAEALAAEPEAVAAEARAQ
ncbi:hypothetical protein DQP58_14540, partial [Mycobacterium colombiense]